MTSIAPGSVKLFGEHAVIYDRVGLSASLDRRASVTILPEEHDRVEILLTNQTKEMAFTALNFDMVSIDQGRGQPERPLVEQSGRPAL